MGGMFYAFERHFHKIAEMFESVLSVTIAEVLISKQLTRAKKKKKKKKKIEVRCIAAPIVMNKQL